MKCQCPDVGEPPSELLCLYDTQTERPFVNHAPGKCLCTNELRLYRRTETKEELWLCSVCNVPGDIPLPFS